MARMIPKGLSLLSPFSETSKDLLSSLLRSQVLRRCSTGLGSIPADRKSKDSVPELRPCKQSFIYSVYRMKEKGRAYSKTPFQYKCMAGKSYNWCSCGFSHTQPFCDGTHKNPKLKITLRPMMFRAEETRPYWFCNCKQTKNRPFCDGTHKTKEVQDSISVIKFVQEKSEE